MDFPTEIIVIPAIFIGLPWLILHYMTKWKTAATLTNDDESLLDELYQLSRRLEDRMDTVERLVASENPDYRNHRQLADGSHELPALDELEKLKASRLRR
ncbi:MAG TPA: envelope stress response membrane protein PspB [Novosphingobium sp.]|mgnify:CR=1 FL=1|nr:envelope stress response membrane protein PspB [Novosphingobium sp.]